MIRKIATGMFAVAATTAIAMSMTAGAASATTTSDDYDGYWGPAYAKYHAAKASGWVGVEWDDDEESNSVHVTGKLWDLDDRDYDEGGLCAYVKFQSADEDYHWSTVYTKRYCGYPSYKKFSFHEDDVYSLRVKVCQVEPDSYYAENCGKWKYLYTAEGDE
ncbi:hypothetical protein ACIBG8_43805 [Nonomuraea sp. NPDC050556]|uniref:hypothetical protein n=1 Tax=Nonomuraea sp. NPDC050556 TaxID=3364369 RepID=UPI00379AE3BB